MEANRREGSEEQMVDTEEQTRRHSLAFTSIRRAGQRTSDLLQAMIVRRREATDPKATETARDTSRKSAYSRAMVGWNRRSLYNLLFVVVLMLHRSRGHDVFETLLPFRRSVGCLSSFLTSRQKPTSYNTSDLGTST